MSDLSGEDCSTDVLVEDEPNQYTTTMDDLRAKVDQLKAEVMAESRAVPSLSLYIYILL